MQHTTTDTAMRRSIAHGHGLRTLAGYRVVKVDGLGEGHDLRVASYDRATDYGQAVTDCHAFRQANPGTRYRIDTRYTCGCWGTDRRVG